jgi:carboxypeptidase PM20D1
MRLLTGLMATTLATTLLAGTTLAAPADPKLVADTVALLGKSVGFKTQEGAGQVPVYAAFITQQFKAAGFAAEDISFTPVGETGVLTVRYRGKGTKRPMIMTGHMDVVAADPKDWTRDPFTMANDGKYLYGRGVEDNKFGDAVMIATLIDLKKSGFVPARDIYMMLSGDEETAGDTAPVQAKQAKAVNAEFMLNSDAGGGEIGEDGKPVGYSIEGAEKAYADFEITYTNPGGHSSEPRPDNAINNLAKATLAIAAYQFPVQSNEYTRATFAAAGPKIPGALGAAMTKFAANPNDAEAAAVISADPTVVGQVRTTCISTMIKGGHAPNALPQRAALNVNCRIFPGTPVEEVRKKLVELVEDKNAQVKAVGGWVAGDASPLRPDIMAAVTAAVHARYPGLAVVPGMSSGASDSVFYRAVGIPSYGVSALFMKRSDSFAHGLNERVPVDAVPGALEQWRGMVVELAK